MSSTEGDDQNPAPNYKNPEEFKRDMDDLYGFFMESRIPSDPSRQNGYALLEEVHKRLSATLNNFSGASGASSSHSFLLLQLLVLLEKTDFRDGIACQSAVQSLWSSRSRVMNQIARLNGQAPKTAAPKKSVLDKFKIKGVPTEEQFKRLVSKGLDFLKRGLEPLQEREVLRQVMKIVQETLQRSAKQASNPTLFTRANGLVEFCRGLKGNQDECSAQLKARIFEDIQAICDEVGAFHEYLRELSGESLKSKADLAPFGVSTDHLPGPALAGVTMFFDQKTAGAGASEQNVPTIVEKMIELIDELEANQHDEVKLFGVLEQLNQQAKGFDVVTKVVKMSAAEAMPATHELVQFLLEQPQDVRSWNVGRVTSRVRRLSSSIRENYKEMFGG